MEWRLGCINFRGVSDPWRAFLPAFRLTEITDHWYSSTVGVIVTGLETPQSTGENFGCAGKHLGAPETSLGVPESAGDKCESAGNMSGSTSNHSSAVWEIQHHLWEHCWCTWKSQLRLIVRQLLKLIYLGCIVSYVCI